jgi:hypothetical protein
VIHMTVSFGTLDGKTWYAICRCKWQSERCDTKQQARVAGDAHLLETNGPVTV